LDAPLDLVATLRDAAAPGHFILVDCLTLWLSNLLLAEADWESELEQLIMVLGSARGEIVLVSNEVGWGIVPENALARSFRDAQGLVNQAVAEMAETVVLMTAGLPLALKGSMPELRKQKAARL
jgi:adenosylcobinamide kinase / adenosylcobinamide-phosphate guanylyltransferase